MRNGVAIQTSNYDRDNVVSFGVLGKGFSRCEHLLKPIAFNRWFILSFKMPHLLS